MSFKAGDHVVDAKFGDGIVEGVKNLGVSLHPVIVRFFKKNKKELYTLDGVRNGMKDPTLSLQTNGG